MKFAFVLSALALATLPSFAHAITLAPGQSAIPDVLDLGPNDTPFFTDSQGNPVAGAVPLFNVGGGFIEDIARDTTNNHLTFLWDVGYSVPLQLQSVTFQGYKGYAVDAGYESVATNIPTLVSRSADGDEITFTFDAATPKAGRLELVIRTDATDESSSFADVQLAAPSPLDSYLPLRSFNPAPLVTSAVPELSSLSLLSLATVSLGLRYRRRCSRC